MAQENKNINPALEQKLKSIVEEIVELFDVERCSLMLRKNKNPLEIVASQGLTEEIIKTTKIKEGEGIAGLVIKEGKPLHSKNVTCEKLSRPRKYKTSAFLSFPIKIDNKTIGVINITDKKDAGFFESKDIIAIEEIANRLSVELKAHRF